MLRFLFSLIAAFLLIVNAQTTTVVINGVTVVQVITTNGGGALVTQAISTVAISTASVSSSVASSSASVSSLAPQVAAASSTSTPATPTTLATTLATGPGVQQGPVGQPASTTGTPGAPIPYVYTTVIGGITTVIQDVFTPTSPATISAVPSGSGTILNYSAWLTQFGPPAASTKSAGSSLRPTMAILLLPLVTLSCWMGLLFA